MAMVGYEWIRNAYMENSRLPIVLMTRSFMTEVMSMETMTMADPRYPNSSSIVAVSISNLEQCIQTST